MRPGTKAVLRLDAVPGCRTGSASVCALRRERVDVVHVSNYSQALPILRRLSPRTKLVLHMHCEWLMQLDRRMLARRLRHAGAVLGCSDVLTNGVRASASRLSRRAATRCPTAPTWRRLTFPRDWAATPARAAVRRPDLAREGAARLVDAFNVLQAERPDAELVLVGEEDRRPRRRCSCASPATSRSARSRRSTPAAISASAARAADRRLRAEQRDVHRRRAVRAGRGALPRRRRLRAPVLHGGVRHAARRGAGCRPAVGRSLAPAASSTSSRTSVTGLLVESGDVAGLTVALRRLIEDGELRGRVGAAGRAQARERFGWDHVAAATERPLRRGASPRDRTAPA